MAELTLADLKPLPAGYQSSRALFDVLIGEDTALTLMEASSSGDNETLRSLLSQPQSTKLAFEKPHCIYNESRPRNDDSDVRDVMAMKMSNLERAIIKAAMNGHAAAVSTLLSFASQQGVEPSSVITYYAVDRTIKNGHAAVYEAMASADPAVVNFQLPHGTRPIDQAVKLRKTEVVAVLLQHGAKPLRPASDLKQVGSYDSSLLALAAKAEGPRMTELLLEHNHPVAGSGALHQAAAYGALDTMRLLIQHGADVNEILPRDSLTRHVSGDLQATWTPIHFAASRGQVDAVKLLESNGARSDVKDKDGKTPAQLLEESK